MEPNGPIIDGEIIEGFSSEPPPGGIQQLTPGIIGPPNLPAVFDPARQAMVWKLDEVKAGLRELQEFVREVMVPGEDYGFIPTRAECTTETCVCGKCRRTLFKPGAQKLCEVYGYYVDFEFTRRIEDWQAQPPFFHYEVKAVARSKRTGQVTGIGYGSANSMEEKHRYRWRPATGICPKCGQDNVRRSKFDDGYYCGDKTGGCGGKFGADDDRIEVDEGGKIENIETPSLVNTLLKMAETRAERDVALRVTRSSNLFTQDADDIVPEVAAKKPARVPATGSASKVAPEDGAVPPKGPTYEAKSETKVPTDMKRELATLIRDLGLAVFDGGAGKPYRVAMPESVLAVLGLPENSPPVDIKPFGIGAYAAMMPVLRKLHAARSAEIDKAIDEAGDADGMDYIPARPAEMAAAEREDAERGVVE